MGITARGAWESVKRHFREMDINCQTTDFTAVAIGDMAGDVFGNIGQPERTCSASTCISWALGTTGKRRRWTLSWT